MWFVPVDQWGKKVVMKAKKILTASILIIICNVIVNTGTWREPLHAKSLPSHPRLLFNSEGVAQLKKRIQEPPWSEMWQKFKTDFDKTLDDKIELPPRGSNWFHWYVCPKHGAGLIQGKRIDKWQWEHICPVDNEILHGDPSRPARDFDGVILSNIHIAYARAICDSGILYQVTGDSRYAQRGRTILSAYAEHYLSYPLHNAHGEKKIGGGRIGSQTLDESVWLIPVVQGADLIWNTLSDKERQILADQLFLPAVRDIILPHKMGIHNIQCWKNSAVGIVGFLLDDHSLISAAIDDKNSGYRVQMDKGVQDDGVWFEGSWGYHFYTLSALWPLTESARNCGIDLYGKPLKKMYQAPILLAMPNLLLPAFNDGSEMNVRNNLYELAYARYHDPLYLTALAGSNRCNDCALWFGITQLPAPQPLATHSHNAQTSGYAILEREADDQVTWLCLKYGQHGGFSHGHPDKNNFVLFSRGQVVCPDAGTRLYGSPLFIEWNRTTIAHNTLVVDEDSQNPTRGKCLAFGSDHNVDYVMTDAGDIYPGAGVHFIRTSVMLDKYLVLFVDQIDSDSQHTFDIVCHHNGHWLNLPAGEKFSLPQYNGYQHLKDVTSRQINDSVSLMLDIKDGWHSAIVLADNEPTQIITATGVGNNTEDRIPIVIFRRVAQKTVFIWAISLDASPVQIESKKSDTTNAITVDVSANKNAWQLNVNPEQSTVQIKMTLDKPSK